MPSSASTTGRSALFATFFALLTCTGVAAQQLLNFGAGALPACAQQCQYLSQAQAACVPPATPVTNQQTYLNCFCQSGYLTSLHTDATAICGNVCQGADLTQIVQWYSSTCAAGNIATQPAAQPTTTTTEQPAAAATPATTQTTTTHPATSTPTSQSAESSTTAKKTTASESWWDGHWKWVLMLILVAVLLGLIALVAVLVRRRQRRKRDRMSGRFNDGITTRATVAGPMAVQNAPPVGYAYTHPQGRRTPSMIENPDGSRRISVSSTTLARARAEGPNGSAAARPVSSSEDGSPDSRGGTPQPLTEGHNSKGKQKEKIIEEEV